jgi:hypothetical protein
MFSSCLIVYPGLSACHARFLFYFRRKLNLSEHHGHCLVTACDGTEPQDGCTKLCKIEYLTHRNLITATTSTILHELYNHEVTHYVMSSFRRLCHLCCAQMSFINRFVSICLQFVYVPPNKRACCTSIQNYR